LAQKDDHIRTLQDRLNSTSQQYKINYDSLLESKMEIEKKFEEDIKLLLEKFEEVIQELDTSYQKKVMDEVEKYENSKRLHDIELNKNAKKKAKLFQQQKEKVGQIDGEYEALIEEENAQKQRLQKDISKLESEYKEIIMQIDYETKQEVQNLKQKNTENMFSISE